MIDHPEHDPSEPCGDLSAAPFGGGEPQCKCPPGPRCFDGSAHCDAPGISAVPVWTGRPPGMLQDDCAGLSKALASKPDAMRHAREAALNAARARVAEAGGPSLEELLARFGWARPPGGWSDSGPVEG